MRIVLVMSEASLWKPDFIMNLIEKMPASWKIVAAVLTSFRPNNVSTIKHLKRYALMLGFRTFIYMALRETYHSIADIIDRVVTLPAPHSIAGVCRRNGIPVLYTKNVNSPETIRWLKKFEPDILLSSGNQIFGKNLLRIPKLASLNRHTSLLPAYGGIYPIFWCMLNNEDKVGISIHIMTPKFDEGIVLAQRSLLIRPADTFFSLFEKCFEFGVDAVIEAILKVEKRDFTPVISGEKKSYYSYPTLKDVLKFRKMGKRMI